MAGTDADADADAVIQDLFRAGLHMQALLPGSDTRTRDELTDAVDDLDRIIRVIQTIVLGHETTAEAADQAAAADQDLRRNRSSRSAIPRPPVGLEPVRPER